MRICIIYLQHKPFFFLYFVCSLSKQIAKQYEWKTNTIAFYIVKKIRVDRTSNWLRFAHIQTKPFPWLSHKCFNLFNGCGPHTCVSMFNFEQENLSSTAHTQMRNAIVCEYLATENATRREWKTGSMNEKENRARE